MQHHSDSIDTAAAAGKSLTRSSGDQCDENRGSASPAKPGAGLDGTKTRGSASDVVEHGVIPNDLHAPVKVYTMLENNPTVMNYLARRLGVSEKLSFYDVYSLDPSDILGVIPRPVYALLTTIPITEAWKRNRAAEDSQTEWYNGAGADEPVIWFQQKIIHGCGLIGLIHCVSNGIPGEMVVPGTRLAALLEETIPLKMGERAKVLVDSDTMYEASQDAAIRGDSEAIRYGPDEGPGNHFVALVKGKDGNLWELEGSRRGPLNRGFLHDDEDAFSDRALDLGLRRLIEIQRQSGSDVRFSCIALAPSM